MESGKLFILSAPSGTGKTTLVSKLIAQLKENYVFERVITYTTKQPRVSEVHGKDYYFVSEEEFKTKIDEGFFLEWSTAYGAYYGFPRAILEELKNGASFVAVLDRQGAYAVKAQVHDCTLIWLKPPTFEVLEKRLCERAQDTQEVIQYRLQLAQKELEDEEKQPFFDHSIVNDTFEDALNSLTRIISQELSFCNT